jgi:hypothetical protein
MKKIIKYEFGFTSKTWHELSVSLSLSYVEIKNLLNSNLNLAAYGHGLSHILTFFVCVPFRDKNKEHIRFYANDKGLDIVRQLDYATFSQLSLENALKMQANVFLQALNKVRKRKKAIPDFDFERFYADVEKLFAENRWIENEKDF